MPRNSRLDWIGMMRRFQFLITVSFCFYALLSTAQENVAAEHPLVVGYFRDGIACASNSSSRICSRKARSILDQINYSQGNIAGSQCVIADPNADLNYSFSADDSVDGTADTPQMALRGNFHQLQELKRLYPHIKILISLEGTADVFVEAAQPVNRHSFVASCIQRFIKGNFADGIEAPGLFDGIDVDWEYPEEADKFNFIALLGEFRRQLNAAGPNLLLTVAMGDSRIAYQHLDMKAVALYVNEVGVMNYDYSGPWSKRTGLVAPLYSSPGDLEKGGDVDSTIRGYKERRRAQHPKCCLAFPSTPIPGSQVSEANHGLFQLGEPSRNDSPYNYIVSIQSKFTTYRDPKSMAPWLFDGSTFWTYDDEMSIGAKLKYASQQALGGVMIWELSGDTPGWEVAQDHLRANQKS